MIACADAEVSSARRGDEALFRLTRPTAGYKLAQGKSASRTPPWVPRREKNGFAPTGQESPRRVGASIPDVTFVNSQAVFATERPEFILKRNCAMMLFLMRDKCSNLFEFGLPCAPFTYGVRASSALPRRAFQIKAFYPAKKYAI
jgi:hypothetical protein